MHDRFFVWIDDEVTSADAYYLATRHPAGSALYLVHPAVGLMADDLTAIRALTGPGLHLGPIPTQLRRRRQLTGSPRIPGSR